MKWAIALTACLCLAWSQEVKRPRITGVAHIGLMAQDINQSRAFYTGFQDGANLMISKEAIIGMSQDLSQGKMIRDKGVNVQDYFPKGSLVWVDSWAMTKGGEKKKALVEAWLNHELSVDTQKKHVEKYYRGGVNADLVPVLDPAIIKGTHMDDMGMFDRLTLMRNPESWEKRLKLWNEVKAAP